MVASSSAVSSAEKPMSSLRRLDTAAFAAASGVRRSWLTADKQRPSEFVCARDGFGFARLLGQFRLLGEPGRLVGDGPEHPTVAGGQLVAGQQ